MTTVAADRAGRGLRALVLGGGIMGLCTAWALEREGWSVALVDQDPVPNPRGASHDQHRLIRHAYGAAHGYMRMVDHAHRDWDTLFAALGPDADGALLVPTGTLALGDAPEGWLADTIAALRAEHRPAELVPLHALARRFPALRGEGLAEALFLPSGGVLLADRILAALVRHLARRGVAIRRGRAVSVDPARAALRLEDGTASSADLLVVAAGPWAPRLMPALSGRVVPSRQVVVYLEPPSDLAGAWARMPMLLDLSAGGGFYAVPPVAGTGLKVGDHRFSMRGDPDEPREASAREAEEILALARPRLRRAGEYRVTGARACYYDVSEGERFLLEAPGPATLVLSGFSGHGFKFAPTLGLAAAEAARDPSRRAAIAAWAAGG